MPNFHCPPDWMEGNRTTIYDRTLLLPVPKNRSRSISKLVYRQSTWDGKITGVDSQNACSRSSASVRTILHHTLGLELGRLKPMWSGSCWLSRRGGFCGDILAKATRMTLSISVILTAWALFGAGVNLERSSSQWQDYAIEAPSPKVLESWRRGYRPYCINSMTLGETQSDVNRRLETKVLGRLTTGRALPYVMI